MIYAYNGGAKILPARRKHLRLASISEAWWVVV